MNDYVKMIIVRQLQADRRAEAAANRLAADCRRGQAAGGRGEKWRAGLRRLTVAPWGDLRAVVWTR